ncbi:hypothetical protein [Hoeflea sp. TYP-13]|uniref:hypothetical protein n=1 Tax=Hoeflea sp. TYP-13 TaxID=3230023 RepID=UPI0034C5D482
MNGVSKPPSMPWSSFLGVIVMAIGLVAGYVTLQNNVTANAEDVSEVEMRIDRIENRAGDVRERLKAIEVIQQQQNETLRRILRAVEK